MISLQVVGLDKALAKLDPALVRGPAARAVTDAAKFAQREAQHGLPAGPVMRSITIEVRGLTATLRGSREAFAVEFGRHPGTPPPPVSALRAWAQSHGLGQLVYPIAQAISRRGIKGRFFLRAARQKLLATELPRLRDRIASEIAAKWGA